MGRQACRYQSQAGTPGYEKGGRPAPVISPTAAGPPSLSQFVIAGSTRFLDLSPVICIESSNPPNTHANWGKGRREIRLGIVGESRAALPARHVGFGSSGSDLRIGGRGAEVRSGAGDRFRRPA